MTRIRSLSLVSACAALAMIAASHGPANAMTCSISMEVLKGGFIVGAAGGSGTLTCGNQTYALEVGGIKAGLLIGVAKAELRGTARNLGRASDIEGTYAGAGAGVAIAGGVKGVTLKNEKGVTLALSGTQVGLMGDLDLSGTIIRLKR